MVDQRFSDPDIMYKTIKKIFIQLSEEKILPGIEPVFDDYIDLKVTNPRTLLLIISLISPSYSPFDDEFYKLNSNLIPELNKLQYKVISTFSDELSGLLYTKNFDTILDKLNKPAYIKFVFSNLDWWFSSKEINKISKELHSYRGQNIRSIWLRALDKEKGIIKIISEKYDVNRIFLVDDVFNSEEFPQFISMLYFKHIGFITTDHSSYAKIESSGDPDVTCWKTPLQKLLKEYNLISGGAIMPELATLRAFGKLRDITENKLNDVNSIVIEAETDKPHRQGAGENQLIGDYKSGNYVSGHQYDRAVLVAPYLNNDFRLKFPLKYDVLTFDENHGIEFFDSKTYYSNDTYKNEKTAAIKYVDKKFFSLILSNFYFSELEEFLPNKNIYIGAAINYLTTNEEIREEIIKKLARLINY